MSAAGHVIDDLRAESEELDLLVAPLADADWATGTPAPGWSIAHQIAHLLWTDRVALVSDCFYTLDPQTGIKGAARLPHRAFNIDTEQARASIRKLAAMSPSVAWAGHADPVRGDVVAQLEHAASAS